MLSRADNTLFCGQSYEKSSKMQKELLIFNPAIKP